MTQRLLWLPALVVCGAVMGSGSALAQGLDLPLKTPDGRIDLSLELGGDDNGLELCLLGDAGALGLDNCVRLASDGLRITNIPMAEALELSPDGLELTRLETYGPRAANASLGTGGLTVSINRDGRLTGLGWPGPGLYDHINYLNLSQELPNKGSFRNAGSFGGVDGEWLIGDDGWTVISQHYADSNTQTLVTELEDRETGMRVTVTDVVHPEKDLMARNFDFSRPPEQGFNYYANMNPTTARIPRVPSVTDAFLDPVSDFATVYSPANDALLHYRPFKIDPTSLSRLLTSQLNPDNILSVIGDTFGSGVYIAVGGQTSSTSHQAGLDTFGLLREEVENTLLIDPFYDIADHQLSGSRIAIGKTAGALGGLQPNEDGSYTVYIAAADARGKAFKLIREARKQGFAAIRQASERDWREWIGRARLPATDDQRTRAVSKRALMAIRTAQDENTGAIVAATTPQTPYREDWVRDGAFFNYALLIAGYEDMAKAHGRFYEDIYRDLPIIDGTWDSFYYPDGAEAGGPFPYEIDSQGFVIWSLWLPYAIGGRDTSYLEAVYPAIRDTADALVGCYDPFSGLQCFAPEDDALQPTQGAQGAAAVYLGYRTAVKAAEVLGREPNPQWAQRADELKAAVLENLCVEDGCPGGRGGIYLVWPSKLLTAEDPETAALFRQQNQHFAEGMDAVSNFERPEIGGFFQYPMEKLMPLGLYWQDANRATRLDGWVKWLTHDLAEPGVLHYGERIFRDGERSYRHSVGFPHIWSGSEVYIAAAHVYGLDNCSAGAERVGDAPCGRQLSASGSGGSDASNSASAGSGSGGGGCTLAAGTRWDPALPALVLMAMFILAGRWRKRSFRRRSCSL